MKRAGVNHAQTLVGHHGFGVRRCFLGEGRLSTDRPRSGVREGSLRKKVHRAGAVDAACPRGGNPGRNREEKQHQHQGESLVGGSHGQFEGLALLEAKGSVHHKGGGPLRRMAHD